MTSLHDYLKSLKTAVDTDETASDTIRLVRSVLESVNTSGDHGEMWNTARQSLGYVLDVAVNQGTPEDMRELLDNLDSGGDYSAQPSPDQSERLLGQLYRHNYRPDDEDTKYGDLPLDAVLEAWNSEVGRCAVYSLQAYVEATEGVEWDEEDDEDDSE